MKGSVAESKATIVPLWMRTPTLGAIFATLFEIFGSDDDTPPQFTTLTVVQMATLFNKLYPYTAVDLAVPHPYLLRVLTPYANKLNKRFAIIPLMQDLPVAGWRVSADIVVLCGGQVIDVAQHMYTAQRLRALNIATANTHYVITDPFPQDQPTLAQYNVATSLLLKLSAISPVHPATKVPNEIPMAFFRHIKDGIKLYRLSFGSATKTLEGTKEYIRLQQPNRPLNILVACTQTQEAETAISATFGTALHNIKVVSYIHPKLARVKQQYWNTTAAQTAALNLCNLKELLYDVANGATPPVNI